MKILAIETSCDETAIALIEANGGLKTPKFRISQSIVSSQIAVHRPFGGVVPNLAKREHLKNLPILIKRIMNYELGIRNKAKKNIIHNSKFIIPDILAVTVGPGLEPALWAGINFAKEIYKTLNPKPHTPYPKLIGANHLEGHLYSFLLAKKYKKLKSVFPAIALVVSGGHTILLAMKSLTKTKKLGETRDDAVGECFDKVARMLNLPYPGGPEIERLALSLPKGEKPSINFPRPMINQKNYDFSFSGLKTSVLYYLRDNKNTKPADIAASFQKAAIDVLLAKTMRATKESKAKSIMLSGGVAANKTLRKVFRKAARENNLQFFSANIKFNTDNAVMIAVAAYVQFLRKKNRAIKAQANLNL